ncbi:MAG TPA: transaldolase [Solirubrobacteraceae bacterium]|nr:transaldolase [Solirubrobacteraceae bacterium]
MSADGRHSPLQRLSALGQSVWIDYLSREIVRSGHLAQLIEQDAVVGVTSNPTIFEHAMAAGESYDEALSALARAGAGTEEIFWSMAREDVADACDILRPVHQRSSGRDGYVSIEVDPGLAYETLATYRAALTLHEQIDRENLLVKIPATKPGLAAIEDVIAKGRSINVTLIFSLQRYAEVAESYIRGLERLVAAGGDPARVHSVASFFVSRIDTETDRRLDEVGGHDELKGRLAIANAKLAYQHFKEVFAGERWEYLAGKGATPQRVLWASTSTKSPAYSDILYVEELIGPETVNTMPEETLLAYQDHGEPQLRLESGLEEARALFEELAAVGVDYDDVTATLEREGVAKFADSFAKLLKTLEEKATALSAA